MVRPCVCVPDVPLPKYPLVSCLTVTRLLQQLLRRCILELFYSPVALCIQNKGMKKVVHCLRSFKRIFNPNILLA